MKKNDLDKPKKTKPTKNIRTDEQRKKCGLRSKCKNLKKELKKSDIKKGDVNKNLKFLTSTGTLNDDAKNIFKTALESGKDWTTAIMEAGISPVDAASIIDDHLKNRRDGVGVYLVAERHLISAMNSLAQLQSNSGDERIRLMASVKLSDTAFKVLVARPYIDQVNKLQTLLPSAQSCNSSVWDTELEKCTPN
jgi:hypothetical protein